MDLFSSVGIGAMIALTKFWCNALIGLATKPYKHCRFCNVLFMLFSVSG